MNDLEILERKKELKRQLIQLTEDEIKELDEWIAKIKREGKR